METDLLRSSRIPDGILCSIIPFDGISTRQSVPLDIDNRAWTATKKNMLYKNRLLQGSSVKNKSKLIKM